MRKPVKIHAASDAEHQRWKAEAKRRGWTLSMLVRTLLNEAVERARREQEQAGAA